MARDDEQAATASEPVGFYEFTHPRCGSLVQVVGGREQPHVCVALPKEQQRWPEHDGARPRRGGPQLSAEQFARLQALKVAASTYGGDELGVAPARVLDIATLFAEFIVPGCTE